MLIQITNPVGIDVQLQKFQSYIHTRLIALWNVTTEYECYARASRNKTEDGYAAEIFTAGKDYKPVYWNDTLSAISFFGIDQRMDNEGGQFTTKVHLVFFVNVKKLKPSITHRADEEVKKDVLNACGNGMFQFHLESVETGIENVLREYPGSRRDERLKYVDKQPVHCFRLNFTTTYKINVQDC